MYVQPFYFLPFKNTGPRNFHMYSSNINTVIAILDLTKRQQDAEHLRIGSLNRWLLHSQSLHACYYYSNNNCS